MNPDVEFNQKQLQQKVRKRPVLFLNTNIKVFYAFYLCSMHEIHWNKKHCDRNISGLQCVMNVERSRWRRKQENVWARVNHRPYFRRIKLVETVSAKCKLIQKVYLFRSEQSLFSLSLPQPGHSAHTGTTWWMFGFTKCLNQLWHH